MPFGLTNALGTFERLKEKVLKGLQYETCLVYLDDIIVKGRTFEKHLKNFNQVFDRFRAAGLKLSPQKVYNLSEKCYFPWSCSLAFPQIQQKLWQLEIG